MSKRDDRNRGKKLLRKLRQELARSKADLKDMLKQEAKEKALLRTDSSDHRGP